jgi:hypothetical protein
MGDETQDRGGPETPSRPPNLSDLARLCAELNRLGARYIVVGGLAVIQAGYSRSTEDIDLLIEATPDNEARVIEALHILPDQAARELKPGDIDQYTVVRVSDEVLVDLMKSSCGVTYSEAISDAAVVDVEGVAVPFASPRTLWRMKQTVRAKDIPDRLFLRRLLDAEAVQGHPEPAMPRDNPIMRWFQKIKRWWQGPPPVG